MSSLVVPVTTISKVRTHPNADALDIAEVLGWQVVVPRGRFSEGDKVVYFPPDSVLPLKVSERFGVTKYLSKGRVRSAKLRGEPSFGLAVDPDDLAWLVGENVAKHYGATKYEPPLRPSAGDAAPNHPLFWAYTDIENMRNFPNLLQEGEEVVITEKVYGTNCRIGVVEGEVMAGSKGLRRKPPPDGRQEASLYWFPYTLEPVRNLLNHLSEEQGHRQVILFGEVYGSKVQSFTYGLQGTLGFRAFDLLVDGKYLNWHEFKRLCEQYEVPIVPTVAEGPFSLDRVRPLSNGDTLVPGASGSNIREGVVVKPQSERTDPTVGRVILKYLSDEYLFGEKTDYAEQ
ncbi:MAG: RNA ligase (ATP) [Chloroflexia bacterium]